MTTIETVDISAGTPSLRGDLVVPLRPKAVVVFAHGSGSGRGSPRNRAVADVLNEGGFATLLVDLLTSEEDAEDRATRRPRFDVGLLGERVVAAVDWLETRPDVGGLPVGCFGASTGAAAALIAAARRAGRIAAVVSRGGRPDLAVTELQAVLASTLLIVGSEDREVLEINRRAAEHMTPAPRLEVVPGAGHLFEEPGALERVAELSLEWFGAMCPVRP